MAPDTHEDPRAERSRVQLSNALTTLLSTREPREISVSALCAEAGVSRPTFYQHFTSIDEVAVAGVEQRFRRLRADLVDPSASDATYRLLVSFLEDLERERPAWQRTIGSGTAYSGARDAVERWFADRLAERTPEASRTEVRYAAAGFLGAVRAWMLQDDGPERPSATALAASLVDLSSRVLSPAVGTRPTLDP